MENDKLCFFRGSSWNYLPSNARVANRNGGQRDPLQQFCAVSDEDYAYEE